MFRLFLAFNLLLLNLYACKNGFESCQQKAIDSNSLTKNLLQIPISKNQRLVHSTQIPNVKIIKYDEFLSLYLIEDRVGFRYPFIFKDKKPDYMAALDNKNITRGKISKRQVGLNKFASFSKALNTPSLLTSGCCYLEGIATDKGVIGKDYLKHFLDSKNNTYGDVGIRVDQKAEKIIVNAVDPYVVNNPFKLGDCILKVNGEKVRDSAMLMKNILFSKIGTRQSFLVKRDSKIINLRVKTQKRFGGGYVSDTFLERKGIYFDKDLQIIRVTTLKEGGLKLCDRLVQVNEKKVQNQQEVMQIISNESKVSSLLIQRDNFQFFVNLN